MSAVLREHGIMANEHVKTLRLAVPGALCRTGELTVKLQTGLSRKGFENSQLRLQIWAKRIQKAK